MIFLTLGSQKFPFNRLLMEVDRLIQEKKIADSVIAQIGYSDYQPRYFRSQNFIEPAEFQSNLEECDFVITHGGSGTIVTALRFGKKVIAVPRLAKYKEHVDDHQLEITTAFSQANYILTVTDIAELEHSIRLIPNKKFEHFVSNNEKLIANIADYINRQ